MFYTIHTAIPVQLGWSTKASTPLRSSPSMKTAPCQDSKIFRDTCWELGYLHIVGPTGCRYLKRYSVAHLQNAARIDGVTWFWQVSVSGCPKYPLYDTRLVVLHNAIAGLDLDRRFNLLSGSSVPVLLNRFVHSRPNMPTMVSTARYLNFS